MSDRATPAEPRRGWITYHLLPYAFADADRNGIGDLRGISSRVPYLRALGIDAVRLGPIFPSARTDDGYDVVDPRDVDLRLGTLGDFDDLVGRLHGAGLRAILTLVPDHTSQWHPWFREAVAAGPGSEARNRYRFRDGRGAGGEHPPDSERSAEGDPVWTPVGDGQWFRHRGSAEHPELDWDDDNVRADFSRTLRFWSGRGADGFCVEADEPFWARRDLHDITRCWRRELDAGVDPGTVIGAIRTQSGPRTPVPPPEGCAQLVACDLAAIPFSADAFRQAIGAHLALAATSDATPTWSLAHDAVERHPTRYAADDAAQGLRRARAATLLMLALPGAACLFQGEELGLHEVTDIGDDERQDPWFFRSTESSPGRDGHRVPLPWTSEGPSYGFGGPTDLPPPPWFADVSVRRQEGDPGSTLALYRRALALRRALQHTPELAWIDTGHPELIGIDRLGGWTAVANFSTRALELPRQMCGRLVLSSATRPLRSDASLIRGETTVWLHSG